MSITTELVIKILLAAAAAFAISFISTPGVKFFAHRVGAMDVPLDGRRMHKTPIPRLGGLAIFLGFLLSVVIFAEVNRQIQGILMGSLIIVFIGVIDDIAPLKAWQKFIVQIFAAGVAVYHGIIIEALSNPFHHGDYISLGVLAVPITIIWIVAITNSVNLIDGLDGLAVGVSIISSVSMLAISLLLFEWNIAVILAALTGACVGFMPYNMNPAKIFMGDTGALLLGYVLATVSVTALFKVYAIISFAVPFLALALPIFDTAFAFIRRILKKQNPMSADRAHVHHRLLDMGLSQKQAVAVIYVISGVMGLLAVILTSEGWLRTLLIFLAFVIVTASVVILFRSKLIPGSGDGVKGGDIPQDESGGAADAGNEGDGDAR